MKNIIFLLITFLPFLSNGQYSFIEIQGGYPKLPLSILGAYTTPPSKDNIILSTLGLVNEKSIWLTASPSWYILNSRNSLVMTIGAGAGVHYNQIIRDVHPHVEFLTSGVKSQGCLRPEHEFTWDIRIDLGLDGDYWHMINIGIQTKRWFRLTFYSQTKLFTGPRIDLNYKFMSFWAGAGISKDLFKNIPLAAGFRLTPGIYKNNQKVLPF
ncbi:MAG TPA: hypothetical protein VGE63_02335 [Candidatus Paceibacterota bacterium]